ncbi:MAG: metallopeptidase TldD-related protein [bacterium]|jgi:predicted Zn-dependent protease|nr:metallopeptidase TldD-related protein [bacterium]
MIGYTRARQDELLDHTLELCRGLERAELRLSAGGEALSRFANNGIQQNLSQQDAGLHLTVLDQGRLGLAETNRLDEEGCRNLVETARRVASFQEPAKDLEPLVASCPTPERDCLDEATAAWGPEEKAARLALTFELAREEGLEASGILTNSWSQLAIANNAGLRCRYQGSTARFSTTFHGADASGWTEGQARTYGGVDVEALSREARRIARQAAAPRAPEPGAWTVVLPPAAVADLLMFLNWLGFGAQDHLAGTSPLAGKVGRQLFSPLLTVTDDADHPLTDGMPFDFDGLPRRAVPLVREGVFLGPVHDRVTARQAGVESTGHALPRPNPHGPFPGNLVVAPGPATLDELVAGTERGLYVTHLHYTNVQDRNEMLLTGMTRDGLFLIEQGRITGAVHNMRFTESLFKAFANIDAVTRDQVLHGGFFGGGFVLPGMRIRDFHFTSESGF